jgi:hypothetical protein
MDPLSRFEADRYNAAWKTVLEVPVFGTRDHVKVYDAMCRLSVPDRHLAHAALEAQRPPVSERLTASELQALIDRNARWVPPQARTPSPVPRYGRAADGRRIRSPSLIRRIRAERLNREKADELASLKEAKARMEMHGKRARPPATGDGQPITPRQALLIDGIEIKGVAWGDESPRARRCGIMSEMRYASMVFGLSHMISSHNGLNAGATMSTLEGVVQGLVDDVNVARFKVGITWNPPHRWANDRYGYEMNYSRMHLLLVDESPSKCGLYEAILIKAFQKHAKIDNVKIGDDNRQNVSPHYVYLVTKLVG